MVSGCTACPLSLTRKQTVFGVGDEQADWLFIGEGPGAEEDARGEATQESSSVGEEGLDVFRDFVEGLDLEGLGAGF